MKTSIIPLHQVKSALMYKADLYKAKKMFAPSLVVIVFEQYINNSLHTQAIGRSA